MLSPPVGNPARNLPGSSTSSTRLIIYIKAGCLFRMLYVNGITIMIPAGGADVDNLDNRLINEASRAAGRWLHSNVSDANEARGKPTYVELRNNSVRRKKRARCLLCSKSRSRKAYSRV